jgi:phage replication O-like protein O
VASPQLEDGYTMIANDLMDAISRTSFSSYEFRVLLSVLRYTYGYHQKQNLISLPFIVKQTTILKPNASRALRQLAARNIIIRTGKLVSLQKDYDQWRPPDIARDIHGRHKKLSPLITDGRLSPLITDVIPPDNESLSPSASAPDMPNKTIKKTIKENIPLSERQKHLSFVTELRRKTGRHCALDALRRSRTFKDWLAYLNESANKVGVLIEAFKVFHIHAPDQDWENIGGRMGQLFTLANKDAGYLLRIMWETAAADIAGSHLNFIQGRLRKESHGATKGIGRQLPSHYETPEEFRARTTGT